MAAIDMARSHVERCLQDLWSIDHVHTDPDGDYPYGAGSAACYISVDPHEPIVVKAVACAVVEVKKSTKLLEEINDINRRCRTAHVYWDHGTVLVEQALLADVVDRGSLSHAGQSVAAIANDIGPMISAVFGGRMPLGDGAEPEISA